MNSKQELKDTSTISLQRMIESQCADLVPAGAPAEQLSACVSNAMDSVGRYRDGNVPLNTISALCLHDGPCDPPPTCTKEYFACLETPATVNKGYVCESQYEGCVAELPTSPLVSR
jgi:hypothetical protein